MFGLLPWGLIIRGAIIAAIVGAVFNWGARHNEAQHREATEAANRRIAAQQADLAEKRAQVESEVAKRVSEAVAGVVANADCSLSDETVKKLNRIGRR